MDGSEHRSDTVRACLGSCLWKQQGDMTGDNESIGRETGEEAEQWAMQEGSDQKIVV